MHVPAVLCTSRDCRFVSLLMGLLDEGLFLCSLQLQILIGDTSNIPLRFRTISGESVSAWYGSLSVKLELHCTKDSPQT